MTQTFKDKWLEAVDKNNSVLCAGLDPAEFEIGRGEKGLPEGADKRKWAIDYVEAVAPYCAAIKPNAQYWKDLEDLDNLNEVLRAALDHKLVVIDDSKLADIGSTNDAGMFYSSNRSFDAVTLALYAGNIAEAAQQLRNRGIGGIHMCLMSNPEYEREKNKLVTVTSDEAEEYHKLDAIYFFGHKVKQYIYLAHNSRKFGLDGIVIGAPSGKNHITEQEIAKARQYAGDDMLVLMPGVGAQRGEAGIVWKYFYKDRVIVNVGRDLMFPNGSTSKPEEQAEKAKYYRDMLNKLRTKNS